MSAHRRKLRQLEEPSSLVRLVDDDDPPERDHAQKRRIGICDPPVLERGEHELIDGGIAVQLDVFAWTTEELLSVGYIQGGTSWTRQREL